MSEKIKKYLKYLIYIVFMLVMVYFLEEYGIIGIIVFILVMIIRRIIKNREFYKQGLEYIETMIWGKPLNKFYWKKGEMKNHKVKIIWKKDGKKTKAASE